MSFQKKFKNNKNESIKKIEEIVITNYFTLEWVVLVVFIFFLFIYKLSSQIKELDNNNPQLR